MTVETQNQCDECADRHNEDASELQRLQRGLGMELPTLPTGVKTQEHQLDYCLHIIQSELRTWGIDEWLGYRTPEVMRLSVQGAINLVDLINALNNEIERLTSI